MSAIALNKKAVFEFEILEKFEAGIALLGTEVKSIRQRKISINEAYVIEHQNELYIHNMHIAKYKLATITNHDEKRQRKLLLHKRQINKISGQMRVKGFAVVLLKIYFNKQNKVKAEIAIAKGKKLHDKRQSIKEKDWQREKQRQFKSQL